MAKLSLEDQLKAREARTREAIAKEKKRLAITQAQQRAIESKKRVARWYGLGKLVDDCGLGDVDAETLKGVLEIAQDILLGEEHSARNGRPLATLVLVGEDGEPLVAPDWEEKRNDA
jgi:hypothetical protein